MMILVLSQKLCDCFIVNFCIVHSGFSVWTDHEGFRQFQRVIDRVGIVLCKSLAVKEISPVPHRVYKIVELQDGGSAGTQWFHGS